jgi:hypothetical protein
MDKPADSNGRPIVGVRTSSRNYIKECKGCGVRYWGRANSDYHDTACRKRTTYAAAKHRRAKLDGVDERLLRLIEGLEKLLPKGRNFIRLSKDKVAHLAPLMDINTGKTIAPADQKQYFLANNSLMWRREGEDFIIRRSDSKHDPYKPFL